MEKEKELMNNSFLRHGKGQHPSRPLKTSKSPFSILENFDLDIEKLTKIAMFIGSLYTNSNEAED
jgi:hypothetical protein